MKRSKQNLSHYRLLTSDIGQLIPIANVPVLPGDSLQHTTSILLRVTPQLKPLMHPVDVRIHHFYVPYRLIWSGWEDFITNESATPPPTITGSAHSEGTLSDYLGIYDDASNDFCAFDVRAYNSIFNHYYRDQDLVSEVSEDTNSIQRISWAKDQFTAARAWEQKGTAVTLPTGSKAPITSDVATGDFSYYDTTSSAWEKLGTGATHLNASGTAGTEGNQLYADLSAAAALDVNDFREAFAMQRYQEARARYGSNYVDYLRYIGIRPSDARLQRPEYLGGGKQSIAFSEVLNTSNTNTGDLVGHGISALRSNTYRRFFEEHGVVMTLMSVRPKAIYVNGLPRKFSKTTMEEFYQKELAHLGQQEIYNKEIYAPHTTPDGVFGYGDRYAEYRSEPSLAVAEMRNSKNYDFHLGRIFSSDPALNSTFIECNPTKRCFADQTNDSLWIMANHNIVARRPIPKSPSGRML